MFTEEILEPIDNIKYKLALPYTVSAWHSESDNFQPINKAQSVFLDGRYSLSDILFSKKWINSDISAMATEMQEGNPDAEPNFNKAFSRKYTDISFIEDARSVSVNWKEEINSALGHINAESLQGTILHIGSDTVLEPSVLHLQAQSVLLVDISAELLRKAHLHAPYATCVNTKAESLDGVKNNSVNLIVGLRVFCAYNFNVDQAISQFTKKLVHGGSVLLSISNGYRAIDDTILPGKIEAKPSRLNLSKPFDEAAGALKALFAAGFRELFFTPGSTELFIGGTYYPSLKTKFASPIIHIGGIDSIPICFYSELMPNAWLGNFSEHPVVIDGCSWRTNEHYFQAQKFHDRGMREIIANTDSPNNAKALSWENQDMVRKDWEEIRVGIMNSALQAKFSQYPYLKSALLMTDNRDLIERSVNDRFWGRQLNGSGDNMMGNILMKLRREFKADQ